MTKHNIKTKVKSKPKKLEINDKHFAKAVEAAELGMNRATSCPIAQAIMNQFKVKYVSVDCEEITFMQNNKEIELILEDKANKIMQQFDAFVDNYLPELKRLETEVHDLDSFTVFTAPKVEVTKPKFKTISLNIKKINEIE